MKRGALWIVLVVFSALGIAGCGCNSGIKVEITTAPTTLAPGASSDVAATVIHDKKMGGVMWSCMPAGSCGSFNPTQTASTTDSVYTAPASATAGSTVTIIATSVTKTDVASSATITITGVTASNYVFYVTGEENTVNLDLYTIAGVVAIAQTASGDGSFAVVSGEQDYNDGDGITVTDDSITGGSLVLAANGTGTLSVKTASGIPGAEGTETFAVVFNSTTFPTSAGHALVIQFDGTATSSGSLDLQTSTALPPDGGYSFVAAGADPGFFPVGYGGVFTVASGGITGTLDINDSGSEPPVLGTAFSGMFGATDSFGRGLVTNTDGVPISLAYYVVGSKVLRLVDTDAGDTAVGLVYSQGSNAGSFSSGSIGQSVFSIANPLTEYAVAGQFLTGADTGTDQPRAKTNPVVRQEVGPCTGTGTCLFSGVGDVNELGVVEFSAQTFNGTYSIATNGYGSMSFSGSFGESGVETFGVYAVDPTLNILDPNDTTDGGGGALIAEMDTNLVGMGSIVPQTDIAVGAFGGSYAFGGQGDTTTDGNEFDFLGSAAVTAAGDSGDAFSGTGYVSDPFAAVGTGGEYSGVTWTGTAEPDGTNPGRYQFDPLTVNSDSFVSSLGQFVGVYQAYGGQLFWVETDPDSYFGGSLEQYPGTGSTIARKQLNIQKPNSQKH
jgi:hypothetical protein